MIFSRVVQQGILVVIYFYRRLVKEGCTYRAASLAYTTLLAIVPVMVITGTMLSFLPNFHGIADQLQQMILQNFVPTSASIMAKYLNDFAHHISALSFTNLFFLIMVALLLIHNINSAFTAIWQVKQPLQFFARALIYFFVLLLLPLLLASMIFFSTLLMKSLWISLVIEKSGLKQLLIWVLPYFLVFVTFTLFNWILPSCQVRLSYAVVGGLVSAILFEFAKYFFVIYIMHVPTYRLLYGALATIPIFLVWLYFSCFIVLLGAMVSHTMAHGLPIKYRVLRKR